MLNDKSNTTSDMSCIRASGLGKTLAFCLLGAGIGAALALIFAPKSGKELRRDISDAASKSYDHATELYDATKEKGIEVLEAAGEKMTELKEEIMDDAATLAAVAEFTATRAVLAVRSKTIF